MKRLHRPLSLFIAAAGMAVCAHAATYRDGDASNAWDASTLNWDTGIAWPNTWTTDATFGGTGETVTVSTVNAGNITFDSTGYILNGGTITLAATSTITTNQDASISSVLTGAATGLIKAGAGTLTLSGVNTFTGAFNINGGLVKLGNASALGASSMTTVNSGATLDTAGFSPGARPITIAGTGTTGQGALYNSSTTVGSSIDALTLSADATISGASNLTAAGFTVGNLNLGGYTLTLNSGRIIQTTAAATGNITSGNIIANSGAVFYWTGSTNKTGGTGTITLNTGATIDVRDFSNAGWTNRHTIELNGGTISSGGPAAPGPGNGGGAQSVIANNIIVGAGGGTLNGNSNYSSVMTNLSGTLSGSGNLTLPGLQGIRLLGDVSAYTGTIAINAGTLTFQGNANQTFNGNITGSGTLRKDAATTTTLTGLNSGTGGTTLTAGILKLDYSTNDNRKLTSGILTFAGGTLELAGGTHTETVASTTLATGTYSNVTRSSGSATLNLGTITANPAGYLNFVQSGIARTSNANTSGGILGAWATFGGNNWAVNDGTGLIVAAGTTDLTRLASGAKTITGGTTTNINFIEGTGVTGNILLGAATTTVNSLIQSSTGGNSAVTIDPAGQTLALNAILIGTGAGSVTIGTGINNGTLKSAGNSIDFRDLAGAGITVNSVVADGTGATSITKHDGGTLSLTGSNTYTGATTVRSGVLNIRHANALGTTAAGTTVNSGAALEIQGGITTTAEALTLNGSGVSNGGALRNISGNNTYAGLITLGSATRINSDSGTLTLSHTGTITGATVGLTVGGAGNTTINSIIGTTSGTLTKDGAGTLSLAGANTYTGATTVSAGALNIRHANALGTVANGTTVNNGATLEIQGGITTLAEALSINGTGVSGGALRNISGNNTYAGLLTLAGASRINSDSGTLILSHTGTITGGYNLTFGGAGNITVNSIIGTAGGGITKDGAGTLTLAGSNTYTGATSVSVGALNIRHANALGTTAAGTTVSSGASLEIQGGITTLAEALTLNGTGIFNGGALRNISDNNTYAGLITLGSASRITSDSGTLIVSNAGTITGGHNLTFGGAGNITINSIIGTSGGGVTKDGIGTLTLTGANTYTGATTVTAGTLVISGSPSGVSAVNVSGGTLKLDYATNNTSKIADTAVLTLGGGTLDLSGGSHVEVVASTTLAGSSTVTRTSGGTSTISLKTITGIGTVNFTADNLATTNNLNNAAGILGGWATVNGTWAKNDTNLAGGNIVAYTGTYADVNRLGGTIATGANSNVRITEAGSSGSVTMAASGITDIYTLLQGANGGTATVDIGSGNTLRLGAAGGIYVPAGNSELIFNNGTLTAGGATNANGTLAITSDGAVTVNSVIAKNGTGVVALSKGGTGTLTLTAVNTFTGNLSIGAGVLEITGSGSLNSGSYAGTIGNYGTLRYASSVNQTLTGVISGSGSLVKTGGATLTLSGATNTYTGLTDVQQGTLIANYSGVTAIAAASTVNIGSSATLRAVANDGNITFANTLTGSGTLVFDAHLTGGGAVRDVTIANSNFSAFTGTLRLSSTTGVSTGLGTWRLGGITTAAGLGGTSAIIVENGAQIMLGTGTYTSNFTITGLGFGEDAGGGAPSVASGLTAYSGTVKSGIGAIRGGAGSIISGNITLSGSAKIMAYGNTLTVSGNITNTNATDVLVAGGGNLGSTLILTGDNSGLEKIWINSGSRTSTGTDLVQVGATNGGTTGTLGSGDVTLHADSARIAALCIWRTDGYTLATGQNILADATTSAHLANTQLQVNTTGTGLTVNGNTIDLSDGTNGGTISVGGANGGSSQIGAILNIQGSSVVEAGQLWLADSTTSSGIVNQSGGTVSIINSVRVGHYANTTTASQYNISGGTLTLTGTPASTPSHATTEQSGGIYIGAEGLGQFTQSGSSVINTKFIVLDNRSASTGNDLLTLNGGTLNLQSQWGIIARNAGSSIVTLNGGTIVNDAAAGTDVVIDTPVVVGATGNILNTSANATSSFILTGDWTSGSVTVTGSGKIRFNPNSKTLRDGTSDGIGTQTISTAFTGGASATFEKVGAGTTILSGANTYTGATDIQDGTLQLTGSLSASTTLNLGNGSTSGKLVLGDASAAKSITVAGLTTTGIGTSNTIVGGGNASISALTVDLASGNNTFSGVIGGAGINEDAISLTKAGSGTLTLAGTNTYSGKTTVAAGTLAFSAGNASATASQQLGTNTDIDLGVAGTSSGTLRYTGAAGTLAKDINALGNGSDTVQNAGSGLLTLAGRLRKNTTTLTLMGGSSGIDVTGTIIGALANSDLVIEAGTTTLRGANTYNGPTFIRNAGTLITANTSALGTGNVSVDSTSTLQIGDGTTNSVTLSSGANLAVAGTLSLGAANASITMSGGGSFDFTGGSVYIGSLFDSDVGRTSYQLISGATGTGTTNVTGFDTNVFSNVDLDSNGYLVFTAIPEPSTYGLLGAGALALTATVRRRRRTK